MRHKEATVVYAQGWLESQIESMVARSTEKSNEDPTSHLIASQVQEQWNIINGAVDDLLKANKELARKLDNARIALL